MNTDSQLQQVANGLAQTELSSSPKCEPEVQSSASHSRSGSRSVSNSPGTPTPNSSALQLDQLANTNLLTIRIKWSDVVSNANTDTEAGAIPNTPAFVTSTLAAVVHAHRGVAVNPSLIENYEYLSDKGRQDVLDDNRDVYIHESGATHVEQWPAARGDGTDHESTSPSTAAAWPYDFVFQSQFKHWEDLAAARDAVLEELRRFGQAKTTGGGTSTPITSTPEASETSDSDHDSDTEDVSTPSPLAKWSVSENAHALTHPGNLYIRGIPKDLTVDDLIPIFVKFGPVLALKIICDPNTGESLGYGFLSYPLGSQASRCIKELNGNLMNGSPLFVNYHVERKERERVHWDHIKEDNDDERFRGVFIGNLPIQDADKNLITPEDVVSKFQTALANETESVEVLSYYLPKRNSESDVVYDDENDEKTNDVETCAARHEDSPLKGYGFIKFGSHAQALRAIEKFHDFEWFGNTLVVNKAVQSKSHAHHHFHHHTHNSYNHHQNNSHYHHNKPRRHSERPAVASRQPSLTNVSFYAPFSGSQPGLGFLPSAMPAYAHAGELDPHDTSVGFSPVPSPSPNHNYITSGQLHPSTFGVPPSLSTTPEATTAPSSRNGSMFQIHPQSGILPHTPFMLPIPTKDQQESNLYVKHLPLSWKDEDFYRFYEKFGEIISAKIITVGGSKNGELPDNWSSSKPSESPVGTSRGYGFVCFKNPLDASRAMMVTDRYQVDENHTLYVSFAQKRSRSVSNGDAIHMASNEPRSSGTRRSFQHQQGPRPDYFGKYNPKFLNAMMHQHDGHKQLSRPRGSWPVALGVQMVPPYPIPMLSPIGPSVPVQSSAMIPGSNDTVGGNDSKAV
ncbi:LAME_0B07558g1_1 [Lachancea meyersii CBS 8951]|uniref:LAME_0B07558g1_1 n=1 Tax=Lachancea meyersii CBS 8951 TaxID=1266667 RepID=A0A1G4IX09_9SACH|nr:LAME_0B07558g1_1 [Lachancea meyersii CBS 8951]